MNSSFGAKLHGVNLGGWLVLEKWITPSLFKNIQAIDEYSFCLELQENAKEVILQHRKSFITKKDFLWMKNHGINAVRIPVGHWIFGDIDGYIGGIDTLDFAMTEAEKNGIGVLIDLHTARGSQNGWDHSGKSGEMNWHRDEENIRHSLDVVERLAKRYGDAKNLLGIELLNEPHWDIPQKVLIDYYKKGYERIRKYCDENVAVVIHDSFRPFGWDKEFNSPQYNNVILDSHLYQCFDEQDKKLDIFGHINKTVVDWKNQISNSGLPIIVGEWSLGLDGVHDELSVKAYASAQLVTFEQSQGWFFWNYKTEDAGGWNFKYCVEKELLSFL